MFLEVGEWGGGLGAEVGVSLTFYSAFLFLLDFLFLNQVSLLLFLFKKRGARK